MQRNCTSQASEAVSFSGSAFAIFRNGWSEPNANKAGHGTGFFLGSSQLPAQRCRHAWPAFLWNIITYHWIKNWNPFFERTCASNQVIHNPRLFLLCANLDILNVHIYTSRIATWIGTCLKNQDLMHGWSSIQVLALSAFSLDCSNLAFRGTGAICNPVTRRVP